MAKEKTQAWFEKQSRYMIIITEEDMKTIHEALAAKGTEFPAKQNKFDIAKTRLLFQMKTGKIKSGVE